MNLYEFSLGIGAGFSGRFHTSREVCRCILGLYNVSNPTVTVHCWLRESFWILGIRQGSCEKCYFRNDTVLVLTWELSRGCCGCSYMNNYNCSDVRFHSGGETDGHGNDCWCRVILHIFKIILSEPTLCAVLFLWESHLDEISGCRREDLGRA